MSFVLSVLFEPFKKLCVILTVIVCCVSIINAVSYQVVLGVYADGNLVGYLETRKPMSSAQNSLESDLSSIVGADYKIDGEIEYSFLNVKSPKYLNDADCYRILYNIASKDLVSAYALYVDDNLVAASTSFDTLNTIVKGLNDDTSSTTLKNDIRIANQLCLRSQIMEDGEIADMLAVKVLEVGTPVSTLNVTDARVEVVQLTEQAKELDTLNSGIPRFSQGKNALSLEHTLADGTKITTDKNQLQSELNLVYVKTETEKEDIPYETTYVESEDYYIGTQLLKTSGREGSADVVYEVEYDKNGVISKKVISRTVTKEPVTEVMVIGTSAAPTLNPTGNFIWPTDYSGRVSSYYGGRQLFGAYDFHLGIDIINNYGNDIWAADSGIVTHAGYNNSYGYYVTVEHADGYSTLYAHMSKIYTEAGAEVKQGDVIGAIGKTGVATAYHLHFEIRIDGKTVNPLSYLPEIE